MEREIFEKNFDPIRILRNLFVAILNGCETDSLEKKEKKKNTANKIHNSKNKRCKCQRDIEIKIENEIRESDFYFPNN